MFDLSFVLFSCSLRRSNLFTQLASSHACNATTCNHIPWPSFSGTASTLGISTSLLPTQHMGCVRCARLKENKICGLSVCD